MLSFLFRRLLLAIPTLFGVLVVVFLLLYVAPGDPVQEMVGERADPATIARLRKELRLDEPLLVQFGAYAGGVVTGDFGRSYITGRPILRDIREDADHFYVEAELPGYKKEEIDITLENQTLTIAAERKYENKQENGSKGDLLLHERRYSRFLRSFTLPPTVDEGSVSAKLADGVLTLTINKREETKPRKIKVG